MLKSQQIERNAQASSKQVKRPRNYGVDLLRIVSMCMVVALHVMGQGGLISNVSWPSAHYSVIWIFEIACYCAVNCYALITGYVSVGHKFKYSRLLSLWLQVALTSFAITLIAKLFRPDALDWKTVLKSLVPLYAGSYWYFTAYFGIAFFIPLFNKLIEVISRRQFKLLMLFLIVVFSVIPTVIGRDIFYTNKGYSALWLAVLYFIGAYVKKYGLGQRKKRWYLLSFVIAVGLAEIYQCVTGSQEASRLVAYTSPLIVMSGVSLFLVFINCQFTHRAVIRFIEFFAPISFGVYIISENFTFRSFFVNNRFIPILNHHVWVTVLLMIAITLVIYLVCSMIDYVRLQIFKLAQVDRFTTFLEKCCKRVIGYFIPEDEPGNGGQSGVKPRKK